MKLKLVIGAVLLFPVAGAWALGLGEAQGQAVIGKPLSLRISLHGPDSQSIRADCVSLLPGGFSDGGGATLSDGQVAFDAASSPPSLLISSRSPVTQPIVYFQVRIGCGFQLTRDYQILPAPPVLAPVAAPITAVAAERPDARPLARPIERPLVNVVRPASAPVPLAAGSAQVLEQATSLRLLSRRYFPGDSAARVRFIQRVAAANPELFPSIEAAFDQQIPAGTSLQLPPKPRSVALSPAAATAKVALPRVAPAADSGKGGRLIIGSTQSLPAPTAAELDANMQRLIDIMNEQMAVQVSMAERLKRLETEVEETRRGLLQQQAINKKLEEDLRQLRDDQSRASYIQLVLAILLGGFAGAALLRWRGQSRRSPRPEIADELMKEIRIPAVKAKPARIQSVFDDLLK